MSDVCGSDKPQDHNELFHDALKCCLASYFSFEKYRRYKSLLDAIAFLGLSKEHAAYLKGFLDYMNYGVCACQVHPVAINQECKFWRKK